MDNDNNEPNILNQLGGLLNPVEPNADLQAASELASKVLLEQLNIIDSSDDKLGGLENAHNQLFLLNEIAKGK